MKPKVFKADIEALEEFTKEWILCDEHTKERNDAYKGNISAEGIRKLDIQTLINQYKCDKCQMLLTRKKIKIWRMISRIKGLI